MLTPWFFCSDSRVAVTNPFLFPPVAASSLRNDSVGSDSSTNSKYQVIALRAVSPVGSAGWAVLRAQRERMSLIVQINGKLTCA